ncbi:MAG: SPOR domain-containing protein, partial [Flavobacteriales bacterium]
KFNELSPSIQAIIKEKNRLSDSLLVQSLVFRAQAENGVEPLEKAYYYREGFACQVKSIELMQQVKSIVYAGPTLKTWSDSDLARMKDGKLPSELVSVADNTNESQERKGSVAEVNSSLVNNNSINADAKTNSTEVKTENPVNSNTAPATSTASATAEEVKAFYYKSPDRVTSELSLLNAKGVYDVNNPIPLDAPLPKGVYYKVQVGAFRNKIPQNLFDGFAPLHGESVSNGVVRYTAGFYMTLDRAKSAKNQIRDLGYKDAFVVAYKDGVRIPIYEAIKASEGQEAADLFAAANPGAGPAKNSTSSNKDSKTNLTDVAANNTPANTVKPEAQNPPPPPPPLVTGYTKEYKDAAPSTEVESIQGVFFTVQVGVYTTPVPSSKLFNLKPLNTELTETKKIRYTTGRYDTLEGATARRDEIRTIGVTDAFVTAYVNGRRVTIAEALEKAKR